MTARSVSASLINIDYIIFCINKNKKVIFTPSCYRKDFFFVICFLCSMPPSPPASCSRVLYTKTHIKRSVKHNKIRLCRYHFVSLSASSFFCVHLQPNQLNYINRFSRDSIHLPNVIMSLSPLTQKLAEQLNSMNVDRNRRSQRGASPSSSISSSPGLHGARISRGSSVQHHDTHTGAKTVVEIEPQQDGGYLQRIITQSPPRKGSNGEEVSTVTVRETVSGDVADQKVVAMSERRGSSSGGSQRSTHLNLRFGNPGIRAVPNTSSPRRHFSPSSSLPLSAARASSPTPSPENSGRRSFASVTYIPDSRGNGRVAPIDTITTANRSSSNGATSIDRRQLRGSNLTAQSTLTSSVFSSSPVPRSPSNVTTTNPPLTLQYGLHPSKSVKNNTTTRITTDTLLEEQDEEEDEQQDIRRYRGPESIFGDYPQQLTIQHNTHHNKPRSENFALSSRSSADYTTNTTTTNKFGVHIEHAASLLRQARGLSRGGPREPAYGNAAFELLQRGTYLVKYGRQGPPHERFVAMRVMPDAQGRRQQYLVWATHAEAQSIQERLPVSFLVGVTKGPLTLNFRRHLTGPALLNGPYHGSDRALLPTDFTFSLIFDDGGTIQRTVDLLALDSQTFRCWILVCEYFAAINNSHDNGL